VSAGEDPARPARDPVAVSRLLELGAEALEADRVSLWIYRRAGTALVRSRLYDARSRDHTTGGRISGAHCPRYFEALRNGRALVVVNARRDPRVAELHAFYTRPLDIGAWLDVPLGSDEDDPIGLLRFEHVGSPRDWTVRELDLARSMAELLTAQATREEAGRAGAEPDAARPEAADHARRAEAPAAPPEPMAGTGRGERAPGSAGPSPAPPDGDEGSAGPIGAAPVDAATLFERAVAGIALVDERGRVRTCNPALAEMLGYAGPDHLAGTRVESLCVSREECRELRSDLDRAGVVSDRTIRLRRREGDFFWAAVGAVVLETAGEEDSTVHVSLLEITRQKRRERRLRRLADRDPLTGLANRRLLQRTSRQVIALADRHDRECAIVFIDVARFKQINDLYGHDAGDRVLEEIGERLRDALRESDLAARIGGDEFAVLLSEVDGRQGARDAVARLTECFRAPVPIGSSGERVNVELNLGLAIYPHHGTDLEELLRAADRAMYRAKRRPGSSYHIPGPDGGRSGGVAGGKRGNAPPARGARREEGVEPADGAGMTAALLQASARDFHLIYQPIERLGSGEERGAEALLRWRHPERGAVSASEFIPLAEESSRISTLDRWALRSAVEQLRLWSDRRQRGATVRAPDWLVVNLSPTTLRDRDLERDLAGMLGRHRVEPDRLVLAVPAAEVSGDEQALTTLEVLKSIGVGVALDGHATPELLSRLVSRLRPDLICVDLRGTTGDDARVASRVLERSSASRGAAPSLVVTRVESPGDYERVRRLGYDYVQGYYVGRPALPEDVA